MSSTSSSLAPLAPRGPGGFVLRLAGWYVICHLLYGLVPDRWLAEVAYFHAFTRPAAALLHWGGAEAVSALGHQLNSPRLILEVVRGCDGSGAFFLLGAAVLALGGRWQGVLRGLAQGLMLVYAMNLLRLVLLYQIGVHAPEWFELTHEYLFPLALVAAVLFWFAGYSARASARAGAGETSPTLDPPQA